jgi:hypothetical protein
VPYVHLGARTRERGGRLDAHPRCFVENEIPMDEHEKAEAVAERLDRSDNGECTPLIGRLRLAHADAVSEIERDRKQPGQLTTGINGEVGVSILNAGVLALTEEGGGHSPFAQFVVAAPPGTGKTSPGRDCTRTADPHDLLQPYGCLFVVDQIKKLMTCSDRSTSS